MQPQHAPTEQLKQECPPAVRKGMEQAVEKDMARMTAEQQTQAKYLLSHAKRRPA